MKIKSGMVFFKKFSKRYKLKYKCVIFFRKNMDLRKYVFESCKNNFLSKRLYSLYCYEIKK